MDADVENNWINDLDKIARHNDEEKERRELEAREYQESLERYRRAWDKIRAESFPIRERIWKEVFNEEYTDENVNRRKKQWGMI